jgi:hypothetical protein
MTDAEGLIVNLKLAYDPDAGRLWRLDANGTPIRELSVWIMTKRMAGLRLLPSACQAWASALPPVPSTS